MIAAVRLVGLVPHRPVDGVVLVLGLDDRLVSVDGVLQWGAFDRLELRSAVVVDLGRGIAGDRGGDRNLGVGNRFLGLGCVRCEG